MIIVPIKHESMLSRRWPVMTLALIAVNVIVFLCTIQSLSNEAPQRKEIITHIRILAAVHPELTLPPDARQMVETFQRRDPATWKWAQSANRDILDAWDARMRLMEDPGLLQEEMDSLTSQYSQQKNGSLLERYAFIPNHPTPLAYLTANFLHGGWMHLIGNMWFLWLAGFVLEDNWGRAIYTVFYFVAGAAALQFFALTNPGSTVPTIGASGAVAALMGAFLVRFPKMKIDMLWLVRFRPIRFQAEAYWLLPLWLLSEIFYGTVFGQSSGVAHWAHVGGFIFGALIAVALRFTGLEHKANASIEEKITWKGDPEIAQATELIAQNQPDAAIELLKNILAARPDSLDACALLQQTYWRKQDLPAYHEATIQLCAMYLKAREPEQAWQHYDEFLNTGGGKMPLAIWLDLCRAAENQKLSERAVTEYGRLAAEYPKEKQSIVALIGAGRVCLKQLGRPQDALKFFEAAANSPIPHLDWEQTIAAGIRDAKAALTPIHA